MLLGFDPRPAQTDILKYSQGWMGIAAVPGSGKTHTLSALAATLLVEERLNLDQEVLIVTLVNSAVMNFSQRIAGFIEDEGLLPGIGYRIRTLHGLANDILKERPDLAGLSDRFQITDEHETKEILNEVSLTWLKSHPQFIDEYINPDIDSAKLNQVRQQFPALVSSIAGNFIRLAKDQQITPATINLKCSQLTRPPLLLQLGCEIYTDYQRSLAYRSSIDFDDLIRLALQALQTDPDYLARLRYRWPYILEDEAQDSSRLQEEILKLLAGNQGNWVRVGDPNQAIFETFTTSNPRYLQDFRNLPDVLSLSLPDSGRSTLSIISLANYLIEWTCSNHPQHALQHALSEPFIQPAPLGDPQPNPEDNPKGIHLSRIKYTPEDEVKAVVKSVKHWISEHSDQTVAILTPRNERGNEVVESLQKAEVEYIELLRSSQSTRQTADLLSTILHYLADPASTQKLSQIYRLLSLKELDPKELAPLNQATLNLLRGCSRLEDYLAPDLGPDWLALFSDEDVPLAVRQELERLRGLIQPWLKATVLPVEQLLLIISQDLFSEPTELALAHKMALVLETLADSHPDWQLPSFSEELASIAHNDRKFLGFSEDDNGFDPEKHKGKVVVTTIHKAKGLEWDRVYLMSVNNYDFPSLDIYDTYISEKWFVRGKLNLESEALSLLKGLIQEDASLLELEEGAATLETRKDYAAERLRLLFVGITRARRELTVTWNTGRRGDCTPAYPLLELQRYWEDTQ